MNEPNLDELLLIFSYLEPVSILKCSMVNSLWNHVSYSNVLWKFNCNKYLMNDLFQWDQDCLFYTLPSSLQDEEFFYYKLFRNLFFYPKVKRIENSIKTSYHNVEEIKILSLPPHFDDFAYENIFTGLFCNFAAMATIISMLSGNEKEFVVLNYWNDYVKVGYSNDAIEVPLCAFLTSVLFNRTHEFRQLVNCENYEPLTVITPPRFSNKAAALPFIDLSMLDESYPKYNRYGRFFEWEDNDHSSLFPFIFNRYFHFKTVLNRAQFLDGSNEMRVEVFFWMDH